MDITTLHPPVDPPTEIPNFDAAPTEAEWKALADLESRGAFDAWDDRHADAY